MGIDEMGMTRLRIEWDYTCGWWDRDRFEYVLDGGTDESRISPAMSDDARIRM